MHSNAPSFLYCLRCGTCRPANWVFDKLVQPYLRANSKHCVPPPSNLFRDAAQNTLGRSTGTNPEHDNAMGRYELNTPGKHSEIPMGPKIARRCWAVDPQVFPSNIDLRVFGGSIEEQNGLWDARPPAAVPKPAARDALPPRGCRLAERILIDGDHFAVGENLLRTGRHDGEVVARPKRRGGDGPEAE